MSIPYPKKNCYFCNAELLVDEYGNRDCPNDNKDCHYSVSCDDTNYQFTIDNFVFVIDYESNTTTIIEWLNGDQRQSFYKKKYKYRESLLINKDNYLEIINKIKKLQAFN